MEHYFDQWHIAKGFIVKNLMATGRQKGCGVILEWIKAVKDHNYYNLVFNLNNTWFPRVNFGQVESRYATHKRKDHSDELFGQCAHDENIESRKGIKIGRYNVTLKLKTMSEPLPLPLL